jgi:hypothetical protein
MWTHFKDLNFDIFPMVLKKIQSNEFWPLKLFFKNLEVHQDSNSQSESPLRSVWVHSLTLSYIPESMKCESPLGSVWVHSLTLSYIPGSMKCDSRASLSTRTFAIPCLNHKPKARVMTKTLHLTFTIWTLTLVVWNISHSQRKYYSIKVHKRRSPYYQRRMRRKQKKVKFKETPKLVHFRIPLCIISFVFNWPWFFYYALSFGPT